MKRDRKQGTKKKKGKKRCTYCYISTFSNHIQKEKKDKGKRKEGKRKEEKKQKNQTKANRRRQERKLYSLSLLRNLRGEEKRGKEIQRKTRKERIKVRETSKESVRETERYIEIKSRYIDS